MLISIALELVNFGTFGWCQTSCFPLLPVFLLSYANPFFYLLLLLSPHLFYCHINITMTALALHIREKTK